MKYNVEKEEIEYRGYLLVEVWQQTDDGDYHSCTVYLNGVYVEHFLRENCFERAKEFVDELEIQKGDIYNRLKPLLEYEEELGIDLITLLELLTGRRVYFTKHKNGTITEDSINGQFIRDLLNNRGITWALTKEELQDEKTR